MPDDRNPFDPFPAPPVRPPGGAGKRRPRGPGPAARQRQQDRNTLSSLVAVPLPGPAPGGPTPFPFPGPDVPAANEPFPRVPPEVIGGVVVAAGVGIIIFETAKAVRKRVIELDKERKRRFDEAEKRRAPDEPLRVIILDPPTPAPAVPPGDLVIPPIPDVPPSRVTIPLEIPGVELPGVEIPVPQVPSPAPVQVPEIPQVPSPKPAVKPAVIPGFGVPGPLPLPGPVTFPVAPPLSFPKVKPVAFPRFTPVGDPLTGVGPSGVGSPGTGPRLGFIDLPDPTAQPSAQEQRCEQVNRRRRRKGKCRSGFFVERPGSTDYTTWRENDC